MQAGKLRHRVQIERATTGAQDATGSVSLAWASLGAFWAEIRPLAGRELYAAQQVQADLTHSIRLRGNSITTTITARDRIKFGSRVFEISGPPVNFDERGKEIIISAVERTEVGT